VRQSNDVALRPLQLTHVRHEALAVLCFSDDGAVPMGRLSKHLMVHPTSVTSTVDTLQRLGYVSRVPHPSDRRTTLARITPKGRRAVATSAQAIAAARCGLGALTTAQARAVFTLLATVRLAG
jgi:DNA-binding MarR family transcriptional regulator